MKSKNKLKQMKRNNRSKKINKTHGIKSKVSKQIHLQITGESDKYYELFLQYKMSGPQRSIRNIAISSGYSDRHMYALSKKFNWKERVSNYDRENSNLLFSENSKTLKHLNFQRMQNAIKSYGRLQDKCEEFIDYFSVYIPHHSELSPDEHLKRMNRSLSVIEKYERLSTKFETLFAKSGFEHSYDIDPKISSDLEQFELEVETFLGTGLNDYIQEFLKEVELDLPENIKLLDYPQKE